MKVGIIALTYGDRGDGNIDENIRICGYSDYLIVKVNQKGIARAINEGINKSKECDAIVTLANDILMPQGWLGHMVDFASKIDNSGMVGIHTVESDGVPTVINGLTVNTIYTSFGNVLIPKKAIDAIGYFNTEHDPYGMQDADYATRLLKGGFINYYIPGLKATHTGHDVGSGTDYRKMKDEGLAKAGEIFNNNMSKYEAGELYLPYEQ